MKTWSELGDLDGRIASCLATAIHAWECSVARRGLGDPLSGHDERRSAVRWMRRMREACVERDAR